jgi:superfamily II DNA or RNA helicase
MSKIYQSIIKKRGFRELPYQKDFLTNPIYESPKNPLVLAAGTSSGKTFMAIMKLEIFYSNPSNKNKRTLLIPASRTVLRDNVEKELIDFNPSFTYCVAANKAELLQAIKNKCNVVVALPQTLIGSMDILPKFHNFILDEAHQWYFKSTIQNIIKKISPKYQLLLTGTPSRFIAKGDKFTFKFVPVMDLYDLKQVTNVKLEVVSSSYDFKQSDYLSAYGNLKSNVRMSDKQSDNALMVVCREMIKKLKNPIKGLHNVNRLSKNLFSIFGELDKTIIYCHSLKQADAFYNSLDSFKGLKGKVLISHSENDKDSVLFEQFRNDSDIKVLVAVDRGRLGYNMPELFNVVDFTMTQSLDMLLQMYGRLLRLSKTKKQKIYYKVATKNTAPYFVDLMTAMLCLTNMEWYSKFNGKNMGGILIPKVLNNTKKKTKSNSTTSKSKSTKPSLSLADLDIPLDLNLFRQSALHTNDDGFATIAWTTLDDVRREFFEIKGHNQFTKKIASYDEARKYVIKHNIKTLTQYYDLYKNKKLPDFLPAAPEQVYKNNWQGYSIFFDNKYKSEEILSFNECKKIIHKLKLNTTKDWGDYSKSNRPKNIPSNPQRVFKNEWKGWGDWLGTNKVANQNKEFLSFNEARKIVSKLKLKSLKDWQHWSKHHRPSNIPCHPKKYKEYKGINHWLCIK